jgi:hypothetical protein
MHVTCFWVEAGRWMSMPYVACHSEHLCTGYIQATATALVPSEKESIIYSV